MNKTDFVTAFAPASIGNVAVGFDMLGLAIAGAGDRVSARRIEQPGVIVGEVRGLDGEFHEELSNNAQENTASIAASSLWEAAGPDCGLELIVHKGVPLQSGMGSSATSAVAGTVAANALLDDPLPLRALLPHAMVGEKFASGGIHADNVAPSLIGGLVLCPQVLLPDIVALSVPSGISSVLVHPELQVSTADSRNSLANQYTLKQWLDQQGYLAAFVAACEQNDAMLFARCVQDVIIEPQRAAAVPCFPAVKEAAMSANAFGCSLSGSGPSIFALCNNPDAANVARDMLQACRSSGYDCQSWISPLDVPGAYVEPSEIEFD